MCCRYNIDREAPELQPILEAVNRSPLAEQFRRTGNEILIRGEIRPTDVAPVIAFGRKGRPCVFPMQWGFTIPGTRPVFNARIETASVRPHFRDGWAGHRCVVPASSFYEWKHLPAPGGKSRTAERYSIRPSGESVTWLCGLYRLEEGLPHFVIITMESASEGMRAIHSRMPLILPSSSLDDWVNPRVPPENTIRSAVTDLTFSVE